ncbi:MAG: Endonuclease V [Planctomycetes bacterium ADurb.Bin126]|nr:MAG: Endonuclease V [Planctomycetes bacterium ADurb.Bin126]HOD82198.1 endonuclease V [Phycisphaerae bacterium]HQL73070.1 endonuclease V [Phycisphaerae bacterium]
MMLDHPWDISPRQAIQLQRELASEVLVRKLEGPVRTVAGVDCAYLGRTHILAVGVLCDARTMRMIATSEVVRPLTFPYVPGLLSFREAPAVIEAVRALPQPVELLMCDGQGLAHPRRFGLACHVGVYLDMPAIGMAKSVLCGQFRPPGRRRGCRTQMRDRGEVVALAVRTRDDVEPMYVSVGHRVTLEQCAAWALRGSREARIPEPTRLAHQLVTQRKKMMRGI